MKKTSYVGVSLLLMLMLAISAFSQARQPAAKTPAEHTAYLGFYNETNPAKKAELGEKFIVEFKDSDFVPASYGMILRAYAGAQNWPKVMDIADRWAGLPSATPVIKVNAYTAALEAGQQSNNFPKIIEYGDKILAIDPNNLNAQLVLATLLPERLPNDEAGKQAALTKAEGLANKAITGLSGMAKPAGVSDADWANFKNGSLGQLHGSLGYIYLTRAEYEKAEKTFEEAIKSTPKDGVVRYRLGLAVEYQMP
jgi:tetratricopeptide (TPR) repeat protein